VGLLLLGSTTFFAFGVVLFAVGLTLQAGATGAVKSIKMSAKLVGGRKAADDQAASGDVPQPVDN
jgi:hypothetical protein